MDRSEIEDVFRRYGPMVLRRATAILGNSEEAKDVMQDVFIKALTESKGFEGRSLISTWLYKITTNLCLNRVRDTKRQQALRDLHLRPETSSLQRPEHRVIIRRLLSVSDAQQAEAAIYVHIDGMSHAEAAELLGVSRRTVGNLIERFEQFAQNYFEEGAERSDSAVASARGIS